MKIDACDLQHRFCLDPLAINYRVDLEFSLRLSLVKEFQVRITALLCEGEELVVDVHHDSEQLAVPVRPTSCFHYIIMIEVFNIKLV